MNSALVSDYQKANQSRLIVQSWCGSVFWMALGGVEFVGTLCYFSGQLHRHICYSEQASAWRSITGSRKGQAKLIAQIVRDERSVDLRLEK
jgi:hypothetical protein